MAQYRIGVDVGGTKIAYGLYNAHYELCGKLIEKTNTTLQPDDMMDQMSSHIRKLLDSCSLSLKDVAGVGAAFPSHIIFDQGLVVTTSNLATWDNVPVRDVLSKKLGVPVLIDNDANVAALAEHRLGAGKGSRDMIYITISTGIGGGLIINNQVFRGTYGAAGELGHILMSDTSRVICGCGNRGCAEAQASGTGMTKYFKIRLLEGESSIVPALAGGFDNITPYFIAKGVEQGDALAIETFDRTADQLGRLFGSMYQIFSIATVVYGGGVSKIGAPLMDRVRERFAYYTPMSLKYPMNLVPAHFGDEVGILGAALLIE